MTLRERVQTVRYRRVTNQLESALAACNRTNPPPAKKSHEDKISFECIPKSGVSAQLVRNRAPNSRILSMMHEPWEQMPRHGKVSSRSKCEGSRRHFVTVTALHKLNSAVCRSKLRSRCNADKTGSRCWCSACPETVRCAWGRQGFNHKPQCIRGARKRSA